MIPWKKFVWEHFNKAERSIGCINANTEKISAFDITWTLRTLEFLEKQQRFHATIQVSTYTSLFHPITLSAGTLERI